MNFDNFSCLIFEPKICQYPQIKICPRGQNVSTPSSPKTPQGVKCVNTPKLYTTKTIGFKIKEHLSRSLT